MRRLFILVFFLVLLPSHPAWAQAEQPFIFTFYGGLFFPSYSHFQEVYQSNSELLYGVGVCLPMQRFLFLTGDVGFFRAQGFVGSPAESSAVLEQRFWHAGILGKQFLGGGILLRLSAGLNYVIVRQTTSGARSEAEKIVQAEKRLGYYGGLGVEQIIDPAGRVSLFGDVLYDYRRSRQEELYGDFGGIRTVLGIHLILF